MDDQTKDKTIDETTDNVHEISAPKVPSTLILPSQQKFAYLFSIFQKGPGVAIIILMIVALPVTVLLISHQQDLRQHADYTSTTEQVSKYNVSGTVYVDSNKNNLFDPWERGFAGIKIVVNGETIQLDTTTGSLGSYTFEKYGGLLPGSYQATIITPMGYEPVGTAEVNFQLGPSAVVSFGIKPIAQ